MVNDIPYVSVTIFQYPNPLSNQAIHDKLSNVKKIDNWVPDKTSSGNEINVECNISDITKDSDGVHGNFVYNEQLKERYSEKYRIYPTRYSFTISPAKKFLIVYGQAANAKRVRTVLEEFLHPNELSVRHFDDFFITKGKMQAACNKILNSNKNNYCERPRITHGNKRFQGHTFHDYSNGIGQCTMRSEAFKKELSNATGISPILKIKFCPYLMDEPINDYKTIRFKREGVVYFSGSAYPSDWMIFLSNLILS